MNNCLIDKSSSFVMMTFIYHKVATSNTSRLEARAGFFRLLMKGMKGIFDSYVL